MNARKKIYTEADLKKLANTIRQDVIKMLLAAGSGHSAGPLGTADFFAALYFSVLKHDPKKPHWDKRDRFVLSAGHYAPVFYAALARSGYFPVKELKSLRKFGGRLHGHPHNTTLPGVENSSGPLGQGLSQAIGMALAAKLDGQRHRVFCLMGDGEQNEGQVWEAAMLAGKLKLSNVTAIVDRNNIQIDGFTEDVMPLEPFREKYEAFNWHVLEVDGHNIEHIIDTLQESDAIMEKPTLIILHTIAGKGVEYMEKDYRWHGVPPGKQDTERAPDKAKQGEIALRELRTLGGQICCPDFE